MATTLTATTAALAERGERLEGAQPIGGGCPAVAAGDGVSVGQGVQRTVLLPRAPGLVGTTKPPGSPAGLLAFPGFPYRIFSEGDQSRSCFSLLKRNFALQGERSLYPKLDKSREILFQCS